jgi:hypothetical protein
MLNRLFYQHSFWDIFLFSRKQHSLFLLSRKRDAIFEPSTAEVPKTHPMNLVGHLHILREATRRRDICDEDNNRDGVASAVTVGLK